MKKNIQKICIRLGAALLILIPFMQMNVRGVQAQAENPGTINPITPQNVQDLELLHWVGEGALTGLVAQQPDGNLIAAATTAGIKLFDSQNGEQVGFIPVGLAPRALAVSPDGNTLAVIINYPTGELDGFMGLSGFNPQIQFYSLPDGAEKGEVTNEELGECGDTNILALAYSLDGSELVFEKKYSGQDDERKFCVLSVEEEKIVRTKDLPAKSQMTISPGGNYAAGFVPDTQNNDNLITIYSTQDFHTVSEITTASVVYFYLLFSQDGQYFGLNQDLDSSTKLFQIFNVEDGEMVFSKEISMEDDVVLSFDVDAQNNRVVVGTQYGYIEIYSMDTGEVTKQLGPFTWTSYSQTMNMEGANSTEMPASINSVIIGRDGASLIVSDNITTVGQTSHIRVFDLPDGDEKLDIVDYSLGSETLEIAFSPDSSLIALAGSMDGSVEIFNTADGTPAMLLSGHNQTVNQVAFSPDGETIATGSNDNTIRLWDAQTGELLNVLEGHQGRINRLVFSPDSTWLVSGADDNTLRRWDVASGELLETLELGDENWRVGFLDILKDNTSVVYRIEKYPSPYVGFITEQKIWNTKSGESQSIGGTDTHISSLSSDQSLFVGYSTGMAVGAFHEDGSMNVITTFQSPYGNGALTTAAISPDNRLIISGNGFGMHAWELKGSSLDFLGLAATQEPVPTYGDEYLFSPDGRFLAYTNGGVAYLMGVVEK